MCVVSGVWSCNNHLSFKFVLWPWWAVSLLLSAVWSCDGHMVYCVVQVEVQGLSGHCALPVGIFPGGHVPLYDVL